MSPLRMRMIEDMKLAGLSPGTQATYIDAVRKLAAYYRRSPDQLSEEEVRAYILHLRERGAARGTFKANYYGIQYLYRYTVGQGAGIGLSFWRGRASGVRSPFSRKEIPNVTVAYADDRRHEAGGFIAGNASHLH